MAINRRNLLLATSAATASLVVGVKGDAVAMPYLPYTTESYFKSLASDQAVDSERTAEFKEFMRTFPDQKRFPYPKITGQNGNPWGTTQHLSTSAQPVWKLTGMTFNAQTRILSTQGFHMADSVARRFPTGTQDREMLIIDPVFGYSVFAADCVPNFKTRTLKVSSCGVTWHNSNGLDNRNPRADAASEKNFTSRGRLSDSGAIRPDLIQYGIANDMSLGHVLQFWFAATNANTRTEDGLGFKHPMVGCEKRHTEGWGAQGERLAIRPDVNLTSRGLTDGALVIARTLQEHGAYIGDNSGSSTTLKGAQSTSTYQPYANTNVTADCLKGKITWDDFVVLS